MAGAGRAGVRASRPAAPAGDGRPRRSVGGHDGQGRGRHHRADRASPCRPGRRRHPGRRQRVHRRHARPPGAAGRRTARPRRPRPGARLLPGREDDAARRLGPTRRGGVGHPLRRRRAVVRARGHFEDLAGLPARRRRHSPAVQPVPVDPRGRLGAGPAAPPAPEGRLPRPPGGPALDGQPRGGAPGRPGRGPGHRAPAVAVVRPVRPQGAQRRRRAGADRPRARRRRTLARHGGPARGGAAGVVGATSRAGWGIRPSAGRPRGGRLRPT